MIFINHKRFYLLVSFLVAITHISYAQRNLSEQVNVVRPYKPILAEASKIGTNPEVNTEKDILQPLEYRINPKKVDSLIKTNIVNPEKVKNESIPKLYKTYLKLGGGNYATSLAELYFSNTRSKEYQTSIYLKHNASVGAIKNMDFSENQAKIFGKRIYKQNTLAANVFYDRDVIHFYGYDHDFYNYSRRQIRQQFDYLEFETSLTKNIQSDSDKVHYEGKINFHIVADAFNATENYISMAGTGHYDWFYLETSLDVSRFADSISFDRNLFILNPSLVLKENKFSFTLGANIYQQFGTRSSLHVYPNIRADYKLIENELLLYAGMTGKIRKQNFRNFYLENPFLSPKQIIQHTNEKLHLFGGLRGSLSSKTAYRLNISYLTTDNEAYFINDISDMSKFKIIYDGNNGKLLTLNAELSYQQNERLRFRVSGDINNYTTDVLAEPWHKPMLNLAISSTYNIGNKFLINADIFGFSKIKALVMYTPNPMTKELKGAVDLNLGIDYRYSKIISVFIKLNNLAGMKRERYLNYPTYGFNALVGATFSF